MRHANTYSIVAYDVTEGVCGVAISSGMPAIGSLSVYANARAGAIATQALINPLLGVDGLQLVVHEPASHVLSRLLADDPAADERQLVMVDRNGRTAGHSGEQIHPWSGHLLGDGYAVAGNMLVGKETVLAMEAQFVETDDKPLAERLLSALEAGHAAGGDRRGDDSAALYVHDGRAYPYLDLRVDHHQEPIRELRRVYEVAKDELLPFVAALPTRDNPAGSFEQLLRRDGKA
ncbi:putative Ntn-hydrolase superfamily protein [Tamaricihabitans halophyticus]|uniref:Putative Ntn-hydrolase superfamily protein n=1 Tax=Tamaricihabitans halophyticus TaxID=1262583 RepID=A0A4R2QHI9_9PSEU|nr:DUF1028 domain-containing protein [Tamaricihabitans halophyticus]TCP47818.1 putative Ntn-hydrolase superfamily protein [Tamaricihabitans halophyticus]